MYRGIIFHETEGGYKIWRRIDLSFKNWHKDPHKRISDILPLHSGIIVVLSNN